MRIAFIHDYLKECGGAERVLEALTEIWPEAPIYTAFYKSNSTAGKIFKKKKIIESRWAPLIKYKNLYSPLRFLTPLIWQSFGEELQNYDVIFSSSSWFISKGVSLAKLKFQSANAKYPLYVCYCHTPPRWLYGYQTSIEWQRYKLVKIYGAVIAHFMRLYDFKSSQTIDYFIANSRNTASRIKKFYRRDSQVIYPPVEVAKIIKTAEKLKPKNYFLLVSRLVGAKGIDLAIKACKKAKVNLKIVGEAAGLKWLGGNLKKLKGKGIEFLGRVEDEKLYQLYAQCQALLALSQDEDFGITPVEAMAAGRPVIACKKGGYLESIKEGKTGIFIKDLREETLVREIKKQRYLTIKKEDCQNQAKKFSKERFKKEIEKFIKEKYYARTT